MNRNTTITTENQQGYTVSFKDINTSIKKCLTLLLILAGVLLSAMQTKAQGGLGGSGFSGPITGPTTVHPTVTPNSNYSVTDPGDGTTFVWSLSDPAAGSISGGASSVTVGWSATYSGSVTITCNPIFNGSEGVGPSLFVTVTPSALVSGSVSGNQSIAYNATSSAISCGAATGGGNGTYMYQWQSSANNSTWANTTGTSLSYSPGALTATTYYRLQSTSNGVTVNSSTITITVAAPATDATLSSIIPGIGTLSPAFSPTVLNYTLTVSPTTGSISFTPTIHDPNAKVKVNAVLTPSGTPSWSVPLTFGANNMVVKGTAQDGVTNISYIITVTRQNYSTDALLSNLALSNVTLSPAFSSSVTNYTANVGNTITSTVVIPTEHDPNLTAAVTVNGTPIASGSPVGAALNVGTNTITTVVMAQDGVTSQTYTTVVTRAAIPTDPTPTDATLSNLVPYGGTLSPAFSPGILSYSINVPNPQNVIAFTPTSNDPNAKVKTVGVVIADGTLSPYLPLNVGANIYNVNVFAQDGVTKITYVLNVNRSNLSPDDNLSNLSASGVAIVPAFSSSVFAYFATVPFATTGITITPTTEYAAATVTVNGTPVTSGSASANIALSQGLNTITILTTAQDGFSTRITTASIVRSPPLVTDASLSNITFSAGALTQAFSPTVFNYTLTVPASTGSITVTPFSTCGMPTNIDGTMVNPGSPSAPITLNPGQTVVTLVQTAVNAYTMATYTITIVPAVNDCVLLTNNFTPSQNYVVTSIPRIRGYNPSAGGYTSCDVMQTIQYIDGLGRPLQTVQVKGSATGNDVVQPFVYDQFGREAVKYLPYALTGTATSDGSYKTSAFTDQSSFYTSAHAPAGVSPITTPQAITAFELSPLNRPVEQGAPGDAWQLTLTAVTTPNTTSGHTVKIVYASNNSTALSDTTNSFAVPMYTTAINTDQSEALVWNNTTIYAAGTLYVTISKDENWKSGRGGTAEEYKDMAGHIVLKRTYNYTAGALQRLSTYYVYDDFGNLAFVLPPGAKADSALCSQALLDNFCYQYRYDNRQRLNQKKVPGKGWEYMVYNQLDQLVLTQDAIEHGGNNEWKVTKYDALGRVIMTGLWNDSNNQSLASLQTNIYAGAQFDVAATDNSTRFGYNITSYPTLGFNPLTVNIYDGYINIPGAYLQYYTSIPPNASTMTRGLLTATTTNILTTSDYLWGIHSYDDLGRVTQSWQQHYYNGVVGGANYDVVTSSYNFNNQPTNTTRKHYNTSNNNTNLPGATAIVTINNQYIYDHAGRKVKTWETINNGTNTSGTRTLISKTDYNEIGQLMAKHLHSTDSAMFLQDINYMYNERGWLTTANSGSGLYNLDLRYNLPDAGTAMFNGNIAQATNSYSGGSSGYNGNSTFHYNYDQLNRLTQADAGGTLDEKNITYDVMGNITGLTRGGSGAATLAYHYTVSGNLTNQLQSVTNVGNAYRSYGYDLNGNAISDGAITGTKTINYNILNLPGSLTQNNAFIATYNYDANGQKLRAVSNADGSWDYLGGIIYHNNAIVSIQTEEGCAVPNGADYKYQYDLKDHLGNIRATIDKSTSGVAEMVQADEYYAFGLRSPRFDNSNGNRYLYNGKEVQVDLANQYDYGARFYDPVIGRWGVIDPLAEGADNVTPYNYGENNPILMIDQDGMAADSSNKPIQLKEVVIKGEKPAKAPQGSYLDYKRSHKSFYVYFQSLPMGKPVELGIPDYIVPEAKIEEGINTVYKGIKVGLPYIGKAFNLLKRYTKAERLLLKIEPMLNGINDSKLLRAVEQKVLEYQKSLGGVANKYNAFDPTKADYGEYMQKAETWLQNNAPDWKGLFDK